MKTATETSAGDALGRDVRRPAVRRSMPRTTTSAAATGGSKLQLQCSDGSTFDVSHEEAMMSSTLWMLLQDASDRRVKHHHTIPIYDVPSASVELALYYCRCLYKQQVDGWDGAMHEWEDRFYSLDSKTLCDLAKVASNLDIQPLVDITCRSIAQIMSATEAAHEIRQKFGLDDSVARSGMAGFDFDVFNSMDHDLSTDEYELVEFDQPSVDELVDFINGGESGSGTSNAASKNGSTRSGKASSGDGDATSSNAKKKKKKKKKKKSSTNSNSSAPPGEDGDANDDDDGDGDGDDDDNNDVHAQAMRTQEIQKMLLLANKNPSAVFQESEFEDDDDEELDEQIELFRLALESAHLESRPTKLKPRVEIAPQDVFRNCLVQANR